MVCLDRLLFLRRFPSVLCTWDNTYLDFRL
jgi:hypothetical protein